MSTSRRIERAIFRDELHIGSQVMSIYRLKYLLLYLDDAGYSIHGRGVVESVPALYFVA